MGVLMAWYSQTLFGRPSSSQISPKKDQSRFPRRSKYFGLIQRFRACTACVFFSGVSQISWSTPGVFLPLFSVTRRTARTLPLWEWVSKRCRARTLPHAFLCGLHDTHLESANVVVDGLPVGGVPFRRFA